MRAMNRTSYRAMEPDRACEGMGRSPAAARPTWSLWCPVAPNYRPSGRDVSPNRASFVHTRSCSRAHRP